jgi:hypothetical protein
MGNWLNLKEMLNEDERINLEKAVGGKENKKFAMVGAGRVNIYCNWHYT